DHAPQPKLPQSGRLAGPGLKAAGMPGVTAMRSLEMRSLKTRLGLLGGLAVSAAAAVVVLATASTVSHAQFRPNSVSIGSRAPMINPTFRSEPRFNRFNSKIPDPDVGTGGRGKGGGKGPGDVATNDGGKDGGSGRRPPRGKRPLD